ncbi:glycosyltransferase family 4 protein [Rhodoplanes elegans]|uniref:glycosyltransferase family 4 protein n=1 Tax=Rhodoplanes elegans TaxID=29408 RepID=UPI001474D705|nr:glycosyltransferase family 4 protein [Rhodoplanes elegans]
MEVNLILDPLLSRHGPTYIAARLAEAMNCPEAPCRIFTSVNKWTGAPLNVEVLTGLPTPGPLAKIPTRVARNLVMRFAERKLLNKVQNSKGMQVVFTFGDVSLRLAQELHALGVTVIREKFNCARATARAILDQAYISLGVEPAHGLDDASIKYENEGLAIADAVFCPSPQVTKSLRALGIPDDRLLATSYGWEPARFSGSHKLFPAEEGVTLVFVGYLCVRKGAHILLDAWRKANIKGRLIIAGAIEPVIQQRFSDVLHRPDVMYMPYTDDVPALYRSSDWFVFPSLEEGGPLVTYEAAGCGVPALTSPMGAGAFTRDKVDGIVLDSISSEEWAEQIASLPSREEERRAFAASAKSRSLDFTWDKVGIHRREILQSRFS